MVLDINPEKQEISLGMKQAEANPWTNVEERYPPGTKIKGKVRNMTTYGAFVELEEGIDGLLHVSRHELDQEGDASERAPEEGRRSRSGRAERGQGTQARRAGPQAAGRRSVDDATSPAASKPATASAAR